MNSIIIYYNFKILFNFFIFEINNPKNTYIKKITFLKFK